MPQIVLGRPPDFTNPFRPGAGHPPPYLAGRAEEAKEFERLLEQTTVMENLVLTGLRGVGKTVLLDALKPTAQKAGWLWVGTDLSESSSLTEETIATRLLVDLAALTSNIVVSEKRRRSIGFATIGAEKERSTLTYPLLHDLYERSPGLVSDKLKDVLGVVWQVLLASHEKLRGVVFAYDEAQNLSDHATKGEYPLSLLLDVFQSLQRKNVRFLLALTGLPTLFPKLVAARTFSERMFHVVFLRRLGEDDSRQAILEPLSKTGCPVKLTPSSVDTIVRQSGGYPYFIQFICREVYDAFLASLHATGRATSVPVDAITRKLDTDFFAGRWARVTDRQRDLLYAIASLKRSDDEFTVQEVVEQARRRLKKPFSSSHVNQILVALANAGLVYKNRHGKYSFAVPLFGQFVMRQHEETSPPKPPRPRQRSSR